MKKFMFDDYNDDDEINVHDNGDDDSLYDDYVTYSNDNNDATDDK